MTKQLKLNLALLAGVLAIGAALAAPITARAEQPSHGAYFEKQLRITDGFTERDWEQLHSVSADDAKPAPSAVDVVRREFFEKQLSITDGFSEHDWDRLGG